MIAQMLQAPDNACDLTGSLPKNNLHGYLYPKNALGIFFLKYFVLF